MGTLREIEIGRQLSLSGIALPPGPVSQLEILSASECRPCRRAGMAIRVSPVSTAIGLTRCPNPSSSSAVDKLRLLTITFLAIISEEHTWADLRYNSIGG